MPRFIFNYSIKYDGVFEVNADTLQEAEDKFNGTALSVLEKHVNKTDAEITYGLSDEPPGGDEKDEGYYDAQGRWWNREEEP